jgi:hypothetical protein
VDTAGKMYNILSIGKASVFGMMPCLGLAFYQGKDIGFLDSL